MAESGMRDFHQAKLKAAERLGIHDDASLPRNREIEDALREYQRLFQRRQQPAGCAQRREAALRALEFFAAFDAAPGRPGARRHRRCATRPVALAPVQRRRRCRRRASSTSTASPPKSRSRRLRLDRERSGDFPVWVFSAEELTFDLTVLPHDALRQAPLSGIDEKPMKRASASQLRQLLADEEIAGYEAGTADRRRRAVAAPSETKTPRDAGRFRCQRRPCDQRLSMPT